MLLRTQIAIVVAKIRPDIHLFSKLMERKRVRLQNTACSPWGTTLTVMSCFGGEMAAFASAGPLYMRQTLTWISSSRCSA